MQLKEILSIEENRTEVHRSSRAREFNPHPLTEPCVKVSPHTALHTLWGLMPMPAHRHRETFSHLIGSYGYILYGRVANPLYIDVRLVAHGQVH